jgi:hypothetical protein
MGNRMPSGTRRRTILPVRRASAIFILGVASCATPPTSDGADSLPGLLAAAEPTETRPADAGLRAPGALTLSEVGVLRHTRDFFTLRERLEESGDEATLPVLMARAVVAHAFNDASGSNDAIEEPRMVLQAGDTTATIHSVDVITTRITRMDGQNYLDCNIGRDVLDQFTEYIINFRDMSFLLR